MRTFQIIQQLYKADSQTFITELFREFLNRDPTSQDMGLYLEGLQSGQLSKDDLLRTLCTSTEFEQLLSQWPQLIQVFQEIMSTEDYEFVTKLYRYILGEDPTLTQLQRDIEHLHAGEPKLKMLQNQLLNMDIIEQVAQGNLNKLRKSSSDVIKTLNELFKQDNQTFISNIYKEVLNRDPVNKEKDKWIQSLDAGVSKETIFKEIIQGAEFIELVQKPLSQRRIHFFQRLLRMKKRPFVAEVYQEFYGRSPHSVEFYHRVHMLRTGTWKRNILKEFLISGEAMSKFNEINKAKSAELWPHIPVNTDFRKQVKKMLQKHNFSYETNILVKTGGLGDSVQITPVAKALKIKDPNKPVVVIVRDSGSLFDEHPYIDLAIECGYILDDQVVKSLVGLVENIFHICYVSCAYGTWENTDYFQKKKWYYDHSPKSGSRIDDLNMHVSDIMLHSLGLNQYADCNDVFIQPDTVPERIPGEYVVVNDIPGDGIAELKRWSPEGWDRLIRWLHSHRIIPIQLGTSKDPLIHPGVMDLRGRTTPRQAAGYLAQSRGYVGIEGGLFHLAKAVDAPTVVIFTSTPEKSYAYPDTRVVTKRLCRPCMWHELWEQAKCLQGCKVCLNMLDWESVASEVTKMLKRGGE